MNINEFRKEGYKVIDWIADYFDNIRDYPVKSQTKPGEILEKIPDSPPLNPEMMDKIMDDFNNVIMPGITHWQSPNFFAYFPANNSFESILAEMLTSAIGAQCMVWETSPAAAELEEAMMNWLKEITGLPEEWHGVIQDTASTATLCAILTAREKMTSFSVNESGFGEQKFRIYCSTEAHSSIEKAVKIAGIGRANLVKIPVDDEFRMIPGELRLAIESDILNGFTPLCVVAALGTTSSTAVDPIREIGAICGEYKIWYHIDAAFAGSALILPELRHFGDGLEMADSYVFNPHKWLFTNFDCSAYFVKDKLALINTFSIMPEYLRTNADSLVNNYRDWGIQLGRRFRALKLWFVLRSYGINGLKDRLRQQIGYAEKIRNNILGRSDFELLAPMNFNLVCFRYHPEKINIEADLEKLNTELKDKINNSGRAYITHTKLGEKYCLRVVTAQTYTNEDDIDNFWKLLLEKVNEFSS